MSRSGYVEFDSWDPDENLAYGRSIAALNSAIGGRRGQKLLRDMLAALDAMPEKRLIAGDLVFDGLPQDIFDPHPEEEIIVGADELVNGNGDVVRRGDCCALGALGKARGMDMIPLDPHDPDGVGGAFDISTALARRIVYINDEAGIRDETPEERFVRVREWVVSKIEGVEMIGEFKVGDTVAYNEIYLSSFRVKYPERKGTVIRLCGRTQPEADVQWEGRKSIDARISLSFLKKV